MLVEIEDTCDERSIIDSMNQLNDDCCVDNDNILEIMDEDDLFFDD